MDKNEGGVGMGHVYPPRLFRSGNNLPEMLISPRLTVLRRDRGKSASNQSSRTPFRKPPLAQTNHIVPTCLKK